MKRILIIACNQREPIIEAALARYDGYELIIDAEEDIIAEGVARYVERRVSEIASGQLRVDGICSVNELGSTAAAIINERTLNYGPNTRAVLHCQNKYVSRQRQQEVIPDHVPQFWIASDYAQLPDTSQQYPIFIKPIRSRLSFGAQQVDSTAELGAVIECWQAKVAQENAAYAELIRVSGMQLPHVDRFNEFICEELVHGKQVTLDGYIFQGEMRFFGITASIFHPNNISFVRFDYPCHFSPEIDEKIYQVARTLLPQLGLDNTLFNVEFKVDEATGRVMLIEVHTRLSFQFNSLIERVTGYNPLHALCAVACGIDPKTEARYNSNTYPMSSFCVMRKEQDHIARRVPSQQDVFRIKQRHPDVDVTMLVDEGRRLSDYIQDAKTYRYALLSIPGDHLEDITRKQKEIEAMLPFDFEKI